MSETRKANVPQATYFVTLTVDSWVDVFTRKELVDELDPQVFWQIHRSTLVNARAIDGITRDFRGRQLVGVKGLTEKLEVSRSYTHLFKGM